MSQNRVDAFLAPSAQQPGRATRLARWFRPQEIRERARQRDQAVDDGQRILDLKWQWRQACDVSGLARLVFAPSGPTLSIPLIGRVSLGSPTTFTVRPLPGQLVEDFETAAPRIAAAMGVAEIRVRPLAAEWLVVELLLAPARPRTLELPETLPMAVSLADRRARLGVAA